MHWLHQYATNSKAIFQKLKQSALNSPDDVQYLQKFGRGAKKGSIQDAGKTYLFRIFCGGTFQELNLSVLTGWIVKNSKFLLLRTEEIR